jgi:redox-sensitive bicupin YhaK (pirin superfamily)
MQPLRAITLVSSSFNPEKLAMSTLAIRPATAMKEGAGANVKRLMPLQEFMNFDPFVLWDDFSVAPGAGFPTHPHRGFEAITYMFDGTMQHKDNLGNESTVTAGGAQRFTAGRGIEHSEMPSPDRVSRGIQLWINLPRSHKTIAPDYQQVDADEFPQTLMPDGSVRTIVGDGSPLRLHTPVRYLEVRLNRGGRYTDAIESGYRGLVYVVDGAIRIGDHTLVSGESCFVDGVDRIDITAVDNARFMVCLGRPHGEPIRQWGPYVD